MFIIRSESNDTTKKIYIFCQFCFEIFFVKNTYKFCCKKNLQEIATNFLAKYFVCKFNNFVGNDYLRKNYLLNKILRKNSRKKKFSYKFF